MLLLVEKSNLPRFKEGKRSCAVLTGFKFEQENLFCDLGFKASSMNDTELRRSKSAELVWADGRSVGYTLRMRTRAWDPGNAHLTMATLSILVSVFHPHGLFSLGHLSFSHS